MYDKEFWNERYKSSQYLYGTEANTFLVENAHLLLGPVLSISEGEGRNAVFIASRGLQVLGVDCSEIGLEKAQALAEWLLQLKLLIYPITTLKKTIMARLYLFSLIYPALFVKKYTHLSRSHLNQMALCYSRLIRKSN